MDILKKRFSLIELLVVVAIIAILAAILLPALSRAKYTARNSLCINAQKQNAMALVMYEGDYDGSLPVPYRAGSPQYFRYFYHREVSDYRNFGTLYKLNYISPEILFCEQFNAGNNGKKTMDFYFIDGEFDPVTALNNNNIDAARSNYGFYPYQLSMDQRRSLRFKDMDDDEILTSDNLWERAHNLDQSWFVTFKDGSVHRRSSPSAYAYTISNTNIWNKWNKLAIVRDYVLNED